MTPRRRALIVINPGAGRSRRAGSWLRRVTREMERLGCAATIRSAGATEGDIERLTREAEADFDVIVVAGGDGTLNAAVNGMVESTRPLASLPLGTANVLARELGLPRAAHALARLIVTGAERQIWPGRVGDRLFIAMASSGFDSEVVAAVNPLLKRWFGRLAFVVAIARAILLFRSCSLRVSADGVEYRAATVIATRTRFYAGSFLIAPNARLDEALLQVLLFRRGGRMAACRYLLALGLGTFASRGDITVLQSRELQISGETPTPLQADGEIVGCLPMSIGISDRPIRLICP